jgi:glycosyltransferase involved in cell wall biosynthesis
MANPGGDSAAKAAPKVSVCVPTYNRAPLLKAFLPTILSQTLQDFEIIICDNCSTDNTTEVALACTDPRVSYYRNDANLGPFGNMNRLLTLARGEYVVIVHDDDLYLPDFLEREAAMLDANPGVGMVHCAVWETDEDGSRRRAERAYPTTRVLDGKREFVHWLQGHNVCCSSVMARRTVYHAAGPFDPEGRHICGDFLMWLKLALLGDVAYVADPLLERRVHPESVTGTLNPRLWHDEFFSIFEEAIVLARDVDPELVRDRPTLVHAAAQAQGKRFFIAALAAVAHGTYPLARGYADVLERMRAVGLPGFYAWTVRSLTHPAGRRLLSLVARIRRANNRRMVEWPARS